MDKAQYFDDIYRDSDDPWQYQSRWYEVRKRQLCLASLITPIYQDAIELGCANGVFSENLASRCKHLTCIDGNPKALQLTRQRLATNAHIHVQLGLIPHDLPQQSFDLIVLNEILYYLTAAELTTVIEWVKHHLKPNGTLLCCHWRYPIEHFDLNGEMVHAQLSHELTFLHYLHINDQDFILDIWQHGTDSIAQQEGLI